MTFDLDEIIDSMVSAIDEIPKDDLAYLFATGKSELEIRNQIALKWHREKLFGDVVSREWRRHDLVVLSGNQPTLIVEGKSWIHYDAVSPTKLAKGPKSIRHEMEKDIAKIRETQKKHPEALGLISTILFTVDGSQVNAREYASYHVKYGDYHLQGINKFKSAEELAGMGRSKLRELFEGEGILKRRPVSVGQYFRMPVEVDLHLLAIEPRS